MWSSLPPVRPISIMMYLACATWALVILSQLISFIIHRIARVLLRNIPNLFALAMA